MGKASSSKKVARAARAGGRSSGTRQRNLLFPGAIAAIVIAGTGLIAFAANERKNDESVAPIAFEDHWHAAIGVYTCDEFQPDTPEFESPAGIHTHTDGVIHIHPYSAAGSGDNATLGVYLDGAGIELSDDELRIGDDTWTEGETKCGDEDGELVVAQWASVQDEGSNPALIEEDFGDTRFREDGEGYVIAFVPDGTDIPKPGTASNLAELGALDGGDVGEQPAETATDPTSDTTGDSGTATTGTGEDPTATTGTTAAGGTPTTAGDTTATTGG
jgi:hypothetical protein